MESNAIFLIKEKGICLWYNLIWIVVFKFDKGINSLWVWKVLLLTGPLDQGLILLLLFRLSLPYLSPSSFLVRYFIGSGGYCFLHKVPAWVVYRHVEITEIVSLRWSFGNLFTFALDDAFLLKNRKNLHVLFSSLLLPIPIHLLLPCLI